MKSSMLPGLFTFLILQITPQCFADTPPSSSGSAEPIGDRFPRNAQEFDQLFNEVKNWGRWGPNDQLGAANLITEQKRKEAFALAKLGRVVGLANPLMTEPAVDNERPLEYTMQGVLPPDRQTDQVSLDTFKISPHGEAHSHMDAFCHVVYKGLLYNGYPAKEAITDKGCEKNGIGVYQNGIVTRGILVDLPRLRNVPYLEPGTPVYVEDLEAWEKKVGIRISAGDAIFIRTGRWVRRAKQGPWNLMKEQAGLHASVAPWIKARGVAFVGSEGGFEVRPSYVEGLMIPVHVLLLTGLGVGIFDHQNLDVLAETAASLNRWEFLLSAAPMLTSTGSAGPVNALAIF